MILPTPLGAEFSIVLISVQGQLVPAIIVFIPLALALEFCPLSLSTYSHLARVLVLRPTVELCDKATAQNEYISKPGVNVSPNHQRGVGLMAVASS